MKIEDVMTPNPDIIKPDATIQEAAKMMKKGDCGAIPVCDGERLVGMITDRDIAIRAVADGKDPNNTKVKDIMTDEVHYVFEDKSVEEATKLMSEKQVRRLIVLNKEKRLTGILSLGDVATKVRDKKLVGDVTGSVSEPE